MEVFLGFLRFTFELFDPRHSLRPLLLEFLFPIPQCLLFSIELIVGSLFGVLRGCIVDRRILNFLTNLLDHLLVVLGILNSLFDSDTLLTFTFEFRLTLDLLRFQLFVGLFCFASRFGFLSFESILN